MSPFAEWQQLAWAGVLLITLCVLLLNILARVVFAKKSIHNFERRFGGADEKREVLMSMVTDASSSKIQARDLNFLLWQIPCAEEHHAGYRQEQGHRVYRPVRLRQIYLLRTFNKMYQLYPEQRAEGGILLDGQNILTDNSDIALLRAKVGMVFQKPTPFPMSIYDNIAFGVRLFEAVARRYGRARAVGADQGGAVE